MQRIDDGLLIVNTHYFLHIYDVFVDLRYDRKK